MASKLVQNHTTSSKIKLFYSEVKKRCHTIYAYLLNNEFYRIDWDFISGATDLEALKYANGNLMYWYPVSGEDHQCNLIH